MARTTAPAPQAPGFTPIETPVRNHTAEPGFNPVEVEVREPARPRELKTAASAEKEA